MLVCVCVVECLLNDPLVPSCAPPLTIRESPFEVLALSLFSATMDIWKSSPTKAKPGKLPPMAEMPSELEYPGYTPNISPKNILNIS